LAKGIIERKHAKDGSKRRTDSLVGRLPGLKPASPSTRHKRVSVEITLKKHIAFVETDLKHRT
jgi:hypothetical protein